MESFSRRFYPKRLTNKDNKQSKSTKEQFFLKKHLGGKEETFHLKVSESDFVPLWDGTIKRRSLAERKLLEDT